MSSTRILRLTIVLVFLATSTGCQLGGKNNTPIADPGNRQANARALIKSTSMKLMFPQLLAYQTDPAPASWQRAQGYGELQSILSTSPLDYLVNQNKIKEWCGYVNAMPTGDEATLSDAKAKLLRSIELLAGSFPDGTPLYTDGTPQRTAQGMQDKLMTDADRLKIFSTVYGLDLVELMEQKFSTDLYKDLTGYKNARQDIEALADVLTAIHPQSEADLYNQRVVDAQSAIVADILGAIGEFHDKNLNSAQKVALFLSTYGDEIDLDSLGKINTQAHKIARLNDKDFSFGDKITDSITLVDQVEEMNRLLSDDFGQVSATDAVLRQNLSDVTAIDDPELRVRALCQDFDTRVHNLHDSVGAQASVAPADLSDNLSKKVQFTVELAADSPTVATAMPAN